jgi:CheY-like chemotaxis protein
VPSKPKLLLVEDFPPFRQLLTRLLNGIELEIIGEASDGLEAVQLAQQLQPDIISLDIGLPGLNGIDAGRRIREACPRSTILFVSQESSKDVVQAALALGAKGYVHKSHVHTDLSSAIEAVLKGNEFVSRNVSFDDASDLLSLQHDVLFCSDDASIVDRVARFVCSALNTGNPAVVWMTAAHRAHLLRELQARGIDTNAAIQRGMFVSLDVSDPPDRTLDVLMRLKNAALQLGNTHPRIAACGERVGLLWAQGKTDEVFRVEEFCSNLARDHGIDILCLYPMPESDAGLESICAHHRNVYSLPG